MAGSGLRKYYLNSETATDEVFESIDMDLLKIIILRPCTGRVAEDKISELL